MNWRPKLALAATAELGGIADGRKFYETVWSTDNGVISAGFGLARAQSADGDREPRSGRWIRCPPPHGISPPPG